MTRCPEWLPRGLACALLLGLFVAASPRQPEPDLTVERFAAMVSEKVEPPRAGEGVPRPDPVLRVLQVRGIRLPADPSSRLTEKAAADLFLQFGITLHSDSPDRYLGRDRALALLSSFGDALRRGAGSDPSTPKYRSAFERSTGSSGMVTLDLTPADCAALSVPECNDCCKNLLGLRGGNTCGKLCNNSRANRSSPSEPTP
jgi:hypothetical protein